MDPITPIAKVPQPIEIGRIFMMPDGQNFSISCQLSVHDTIEVLLSLARAFNQDLKKEASEKRIVVPNLVIPSK